MSSQQSFARVHGSELETRRRRLHFPIDIVIQPLLGEVAPAAAANDLAVLVELDYVSQRRRQHRPRRRRHHDVVAPVAQVVEWSDSRSCCI